jgi:hypothetical protein
MNAKFQETLSSSNVFRILSSKGCFFSHTSCIIKGFKVKMVSFLCLIPLFLFNSSLLLKIFLWNYLWFLSRHGHLQKPLIPWVFSLLSHCHSYQHYSLPFFLAISILTLIMLVGIELLVLFFINLFLYLRYQLPKTYQLAYLIQNLIFIFFSNSGPTPWASSLPLFCDGFSR